VVRYGDLELADDAISRLVEALEDIGEERLALRVSRAVGENEGQLSLAPEDYAPILRALSGKYVGGLAELARILEEQSRHLSPSGSPGPLPEGERKTLRETRMAANEAFFRSVNERLEDRTPATTVLIVLCECADDECAQRIQLTRSEYEDIRSDSTQFVIAHGHADPEIEEVVLRTDRFEMVRKIGVSAEVAARLDS
jgi:hypothetical protein